MTCIAEFLSEADITGFYGFSWPLSLTIPFRLTIGNVMSEAYISDTHLHMHHLLDTLKFMLTVPRRAARGLSIDFHIVIGPVT
jgi:hypothetical protein